MPQSQTSQNLSSATATARERLDAHVRDIVGWHFDPATGCPFWLDRAKTFDFNPRHRRQGLRRPRQVRLLRGRMAARRSGRTVGPQGLRRQADLRLRDRGQHRRAQVPDQPRGLPDRLLEFQRHAARGQVSARLELADGRAVRPAAPAAGDRASGAAPRRDLLHGRSRSALGHQAHQEGLDRASAGLQGPRDRPGGDDPRRRARHQVPVHDAEAARVAGASPRVDGHEHPQGGHHGNFLGRHRVYAAVEPFRARGAARRRST